jgi:hypothetical protein
VREIFLAETMSALFFNLRYRKVGAVIKSVNRERLSYCNTSMLRDIARVAISNEKKRLEGVIIEAGCGLGGSAITLASAKNRNRSLFVYDVFGTHPPPSDNDGSDAGWRYKLIASGKSPGIRGNLYYGYEKNLYEKVLRSFADFGFEAKENKICLEKGLYEETLRVNLPVSLAHLDCDWYNSVLTCLDRIEPHLVRGGTLIVQDYWQGAKKAVKKYFEHKDKKGYSFARKTALHIVKR